MSAEQDIGPILLGDQKVGPGHPTYVIAEIGINHNGSVETAKTLIDASARAGASAVKFQKRDLESIYTRAVLESLENFEQGFQYLIPILQEFELQPDQMLELKNYSENLGLDFLCTPFDKKSLEFLETLDMVAYKVSSADLTNFDLLEQLKKTGKPLLISTGMSLAQEVELTVDFLKDRGSDFALLHCVSTYPTNASDANLGRIKILERKYRCPVGYSSHDLGVTLSVIATSLGASVIEKHITLDREMRGPDHKVSLLPEELNRMVAGIRESEKALAGRGDHILQGELLNQMVFRKSVVAATSIRAGQTIERRMLTVKSPGTGLSAQEIFNLVGTQAKRDYEIDQHFLESDLECEPTHQFASAKLDWGRQGLVVRYHDFETALPLNPGCLEFHLTYQDTLLEIPHKKFEAHAEQLKKMPLRVHCCEYIGERLFDLCSKYSDILELSRATLQRVIDITAELSPYFETSTPLIVFNVGAMSLRSAVRDTPIDVDRFHQLINGLDLKNTHLLAQNMPPNPWYFGGQWKGHYFLRAEELLHFCQATGQSLCLDLSHAQMACAYLRQPMVQYIKELKPHVKHIHVADALGAQGEGVQLGEGDVDLEAFLRVYSDYQGTWLPEIWQGHINNHRGARQALENFALIHQNLFSSKEHSS